MSLLTVIVLIAASGAPVASPPQLGVQLAQSTNPALGPPPRFGRSFAPPEQTNPGTSTGPLLTTPKPRETRPRNESGSPPTARDCSAGYNSRSGLTRREFNRLCGQGS